MANKRDEARKLAGEYHRAHQAMNAETGNWHKAEKKLAELALTLKPDPECYHGSYMIIGNASVCNWCYSAKCSDSDY